jgi:hypothetical protein
MIKAAQETLDRLKSVAKKGDDDSELIAGEDVRNFSSDLKTADPTFDIS